MKLFKPEDFFDLKYFLVTPNGTIHASATACKIANDIFNKWLKSQPDVFVSRGYGHDDTWHENIGDLDSVPSHRAKLVCIEEIK